MTKEDYYRIRNAVYEDAGMDKFDFDLMMCRVVMKAVEEEREECAKVCENIAIETFGMTNLHEYGECANAIRARGKE